MYMRKITFFLSLVCALLFSANAAAQGPTITSVTRATEITEGKWYILEIDKGTTSAFLYENTGDHVIKMAPNNQTATTLLNQSVNSFKHALVRFVPEAGADTYNIQMGTGFYFKQPTSNANITATNEKANVGHYYIHKLTRTNGNTYFQFGLGSESATPPYYIVDGGSGSGGNVTSWNNSDGYKGNDSNGTGDVWTVYEVGFSSELVDATIELKQNESDPVGDYTFSVGKLPSGMTLSPLKNYVPATSFLSLSDKEETVTATNNTLTLTYTAAVPFAGSYKALNDNHKWLAMYTGNARMYVYEAGVENGYPAIDNATFMNLSTNNFWGFICENPFEESSFRIVNQGAGPGKYLQLTGTVNNSPCKFVDNTTTERVRWTLEVATGNPGGAYDNQSNFFGIKCVGTNQYINNYGGYGHMTSYQNNAGADSGTGIKFVSELETYRTLGARALTAPEGAVHSLESTCRAKIGDASAIETKTLAELQAIVAAHRDGGHGTIDMVSGAYYRILNWQDHDNDNAKVISFGGSSRALATKDANSVDQIWQATASGDGYTFRSANAELYLNAPASSNLSADGVVYTLTDLGAGQHFFISNDKVLVENVSYNGLTDVTTDSPHRKNTKDAWYLMPVNDFTVTLHAGGDDQYYATAYFPFAVTIDGAEAYIAESYADNAVNLTKVEGYVPANTGIVLVGDAATATVNVLTETVDAVKNLLEGTNRDRNFDSTDFVKDNVLVLGMGAASGHVGFYLPAETATKVRANSAYLPITGTGINPVNGLMFHFGGTVDGIHSTVNAAGNDVIYDLQGRRVSAPAKGIYIINGKKVIR